MFRRWSCDPSAILPQAFGGWNLTKAAQTSSNPEVADPTNAGVLKEYGFTDFEGATYTRDDGRKLKIKAARFQDASGAYGAFTFYKMPQMLNEDRGSRLVIERTRALLSWKYSGGRCVSTALGHVGCGITGVVGRSAYPRRFDRQFAGTSGVLPKQAYIRNTAKYIVGPLALEADGSPLPSNYVNFDKGAEVVLGGYDLSGAQATLVLVSYPTPQIAISQLKQIDPRNSRTNWIDRDRETYRPDSGSGQRSNLRRRCQILVSDVNYDADVTWNERTNFTRRDNAANLIVGVILLAAIVCGISIVAGIAFGGFGWQ